MGQVHPHGAPGSAGGTAWPRLDASLGPKAQLLSLRAGGRSTLITDARLSAQYQCDFWDSLFAPEQAAAAFGHATKWRN